MPDMFWIGAAYLVGGFFFASFVEYWVHRLMHKAVLLGKVHRDHHASGVAQGVLWEYWDYVKGSAVLMIPPFFVSLTAGIGWTIGANLFALFSAYSHQLQHENPARCWWMPMPIHHVHHKFKMWHHNFGMAVDWWDHVFRTYKKVDWQPTVDQAQRERSALAIRWW